MSSSTNGTNNNAYHGSEFPTVSLANSSSLTEVTSIIPPPALTAEARGVAPGRNRLQGKYILVVGGGQTVNAADNSPNPPVGNGRATCLVLAKEGATVIVADKSRSAAEATASRIKADGGKAHVVVGDVASPEGAATAVREALNVCNGQLDGLVLSLGIGGAGYNVANTNADQWDIVMNVNLRSHFLVAKEALPHMAKNPKGASLVSFGSMSQLFPFANEPAYDASKAGLTALIRHIAFEYAPFVRANMVIPGMIDTPMGRRAGTFIKGRNASAVPLARQGTGWDIGYATCWLLSGESTYITGQEIVVDGGVSALHKGAKRLEE